MTDLTLDNLTPEQIAQLPVDENGNPILPTKIVITQDANDYQ